MKNKLSYNRSVRRAAASINPRVLLRLIATLCVIVWPSIGMAGDAPQWMHALVNAPLPAYDQKTDAVQLYSETNVTVVSADKIKIFVREAYKILRPGGREYGI